MFKQLLCVLIITNTVAGTSNGSLGRSFNRQSRIDVVTYEPIDYPMYNSISEETHSVNRHVLYPQNQSTVNGSSHGSNSSSSVEIFFVSDRAKEFLTGSLSTRVIPAIYILVLICSLVLNAVAVVMFWCKIKTKKPTVIYMLNLACADLLFTLLLPLKTHYHLSGNDWVFSPIVCRLFTATYYCYMYCSVLLMTCIAVDRMLAVVHPFASLSWRSTRKASLACLVVWALAVCGTAPLLATEQTTYLADLGITTCHDVLPKEDAYPLYFSIIACVFYFLPLVVTALCYGRLLWALGPGYGRRAVTFTVTPALVRKRRRAVVMAMAVATEFAACFAPTNAILLVHCVHLARGTSGEGGGDAWYAAYLLSACLGSVSTCLDPLLYYYGSSQYQTQLQGLLMGSSSRSSATKTRGDSSESSSSCKKGSKTDSAQIHLSSQYKKLLA